MRSCVRLKEHYFVLGAILFTLGTSGFAGEGDTGRGGQFYVTVPYTFENFTAFPDGLSAIHFAAPIMVGISLDSFVRDKPGYYFDLHVGVPRYSLNPLGGVAAAYQHSIGVAKARLGVEVDSNGVADPNLPNRYFASWRTAALFRLSLESGMLRPNILVRWIGVMPVEVANMEGMSTNLTGTDNLQLRLGAELHMPLILGEVGVSFYSIGPVAVASKEFGYYIARQSVFHVEAAGGLDFGAFEIWLKLAAVFPTRDDSIEYLYQTPFLYNDHLVAPRTATAEVRWNF